MELLHVIITLLSCVTHVISTFQCPGTCYSGSFPKNKQVIKGKRLRGYSYKNITTDVPQTCFSSCINDCRCKAFQMKDVRCELLDEDKAADFVDETGYVYYDLQQTFHKGKSNMVQPAAVCYNGCCRTNPCMNGGTCVEHCDNPNDKFACNCPAKYYGRVCEKRINSCIDVFKNSAPGTIPANGTYTITRSDTKTTVPVYCAFVSPNKAWTLIESFSVQNNVMQNYSRMAFHQNFTRNYDNPQNWTDYRLSLDMMKYIRSKAAMFGATCDYPTRAGKDLATDSLFGYLSEYDLINGSDTRGNCFKFAYINIRGQEFFNITTAIWNHVDLYHAHIDCYNTRCETALGLTDASDGDDCFGYYGPTPPRPRMLICTATQQSTTQWWLGEQQ